ncbi:WD40 repeat domain-containing protein [Nocardia salmonicida]|uniref:WD40 repeat domain-containing protein n=1 Tax=Nocardia salmonicida TaxID=53431 RepID=UPI0034060C4C
MSTLYEVLLFDLTNPSGAPVPQQVGEFESYVNSVAFNADGSTLAAGSSDNSVHLFDIRAGRACARQILPGPGIVTSVSAPCLLSNGYCLTTVELA